MRNDADVLLENPLKFLAGCQLVVDRCSLPVLVELGALLDVALVDPDLAVASPSVLLVLGGLKYGVGQQLD